MIVADETNESFRYSKVVSALIEGSHKFGIQLHNDVYSVSSTVLPSMPPVFAARSEQADVDLAFMDEALKMVRLTLC